MKLYTLSSEIYVNPESECRYHVTQIEKEVQFLHNHDYYELFLVTSGETEHIINGTTQHLPEGSLVFIRDTDRHCYSSAGLCEISNLALSRNLVRNMFRYLSEDFPSEEILNQPLPPTVFLSTSDKVRLENKMANCSPFNWQDLKRLKVYVRVLVAEIFEGYFLRSTQFDDALPEWLSDLCAQMSRPENFSRGIDRMIKLSGKSREHLARSIKKYLGVTTTDYINNLRINHASTMLLQSNTSITDLCYDLGYHNTSWFYTQFKKKFGMSPTCYRETFSPDLV